MNWNAYRQWYVAKEKWVLFGGEDLEYVHFELEKKNYNNEQITLSTRKSSNKSNEAYERIHHQNNGEKLKLNLNLSFG